jgi:hypothetical protein
VYAFRKKLGFEARCYIIVIYLNVGYNIAIYLNVGTLITQACTDFDVCIKLTFFEQFRPPDYENDFGIALSRLVFSQIVFS